MRGFVIKKIPYGESDLIIRFLTEGGQVVSTFAAGGRASRQRFPHQFNVSGLYEITVKEKGHDERMSRLQRCDLVNHESQLSDRLDLMTRWMMALEWIDLNDQNRPHEDDGKRVQNFLQLERLRDRLMTNEGEYWFHLFFISQIESHGLRPELEQCVFCQQIIDKDFYFSLVDGGLTHTVCGRQRPETNKTLQFSTLRFLRAAFEGDIDPKNLLRQQDVLEDLDYVLIPYLEQQLHIKLKSRRFFEDAVLFSSLDKPSKSATISV